MRLLFYTATAVLIALAGVFTFYALQSDDTGAGSKVVLSIDSAHTADTADLDDGAKDRPDPAPVEQADARPKADGEPAAEPTSGGAAPDKQFDIKISDAPAAEQDVQPERQGAAQAGGDERFVANSAPAAERSQEDLPVLPGTEMGDLQGGDSVQPHAASQDTARPPSQERVAAQSIEAPAETPRAAPASESASALQGHGDTLRDTLIPGRESADTAAGNVATQPDRAPTADAARNATAAPGNSASEREGRSNLDAILAALNQQSDAAPSSAATATEAAAPPAAAPLVPPPLPLKRPLGVEPPTRTAALNGWAPSKFTTTEVATPKTVRIAVLLRGVGRDDNSSSEAVTRLPPAVSLAFMPYSGGAQQWATKARELGHEVIVQLPLEPSDYPVNDPGPETLLSSAPADENLSRMKTVLGRFEGYTGVTNLLGGKLLQSKTALRPILENLKSQGLIYVGEGNGSHAVVKGLAAEVGLRYGNADVIIDAQPAPAAIKKALDRLVAVARKDGTAIGLGFASRATIEQLRAWSDTLAAEGVTLVPVGALAQTPGAS